MRPIHLLLAAGALVAAMACGGSQAPGAGGSAGDGQDAGTSAGASNITTYETLAGQVQSAATAYRAAMTAQGMTLQGCQPAHDQYDATVRPWIEQMVQMSGAMDGFMGAHQGADFEDMACVAQAMLGELDAHRQVACTLGDLGADQDEAVRHVGVMLEDAGHAYDRCVQMTGGMGGGSYAWGPTMNGCGAPSGTTDPVALGERVYDQGVGADGQTIGRTGGIGMMMNACASCHGADGHGRSTMMLTAPDITYGNLTDPLGMRETDGDRGPTYTDGLIRRAVVQGIGADGDALDTAMPRWQLGDQDWTDLLAYMKTQY